MAVSGDVTASTREAGIFEAAGPTRPANQIDKIVFARLSSLNLEPRLCSDAVFLRRAYLDVIGTLPTAEEARKFLKDPDAKGKRSALIDRLLERGEFADYWSMKWGDVLRIKAEFPVNLWPNAAQAYHRWVWESLSANKRYDVFVREMLTSSGSNFRVGPANFYRAVQNKTPEGIAGAVALTFMGARIESWPEERQKEMAEFFSQIGYKPTGEWKEEHVFWDPLKSIEGITNGAPGRDKLTTIGQSAGAGANTPIGRPAMKTAMLPDGSKAKLPPDQDPREVFADWLIAKGNPWFAKAAVNRVWAWLLGRGIVEEPDDIRDDNPPSNPQLLAFLEREFVAGGYDLKALYRLILNSRTYQLSSVPRDVSPKAAANFAGYPLRRLEAEVLIDAINQVTDTRDLYTSPIPEPFTYIPKDTPAIAIADGSITSPFLALFGRSARATGMANERSNKILPDQWLHLLNSSHIQKKIDASPRFKAISSVGKSPAEIVEELYLITLSRFPTPTEVETALEYANTGAKNRAGKPIVRNRREHFTDVAWALLNSSEFLYRH